MARTASSSSRRRSRRSCFPGLPRFGVTGLCVFDVAKGNVTFSADLPEGFWVTTIYTDKAEAIYSVNNRQSGANIFNVSLSRAPNLIEQIIQATDKERPEIDSGWTVMSPEPRGLAVVWYPTPESGLRPIAAEAVARSRCTRGAGTCDSLISHREARRKAISSPACRSPLRGRLRLQRRCAALRGRLLRPGHPHALDAHAGEDHHFGRNAPRLRAGGGAHPVRRELDHGCCWHGLSWHSLSAGGNWLRCRH